MCTDDQKFTTVVGPRGALQYLFEVFPQTSVASRHRIRGHPRLIDLTHLSGRFEEPNSPTVGVIWHDQGEAFAVAAELQAMLLAGDREARLAPLPELLCEPGYLCRLAAATAAPTVALAAGTNSAATSTAPVIAAIDKAPGTRVALLDTGDQNAANQMVDFTSLIPTPATSGDDNGHGTAVAEVIKAVNNNADIFPLRVLGPATSTGPSYQVMAGLAYALWSGLFDIVNASLTSNTSGACDHAVGSSIAYIVQTAVNSAATAPPRIVAAAGNDPGKASGYPAVLPGATVAIALERDPATGSFQRAGYNSTPPTGANEERAFGGSSADPAATVTDAAGNVTPLFGTSFAAAAITGAYL